MEAWKHTDEKSNKNVKLSESKESSPNPQISKPADEQNNIAKKAERYEKKILHYMSKLSRCRSATASQGPEHSGNRENAKERFVRSNSRLGELEERVNRNVMKPMRPRPDKYSPRNESFSNRDSIKELRPLRKAQNIISATIEYGLANGIIVKNGKYFWLNNENNHSRRPGFALKQHDSNNQFSDVQTPEADAMEVHVDTTGPSASQEQLERNVELETHSDQTLEKPTDKQPTKIKEKKSRKKTAKKSDKRSKQKRKRRVSSSSSESTVDSLSCKCKIYRKKGRKS